MYELSSGYLRDNFGMRVSVFYVQIKGRLDKPKIKDYRAAQPRNLRRLLRPHQKWFYSQNTDGCIALDAVKLQYCSQVCK